VQPPKTKKPPVDMSKMARANAAQVRELIGDGNYHGLYERPDAEMLALWNVAVEETRSVIEQDWK
jgi:creatinine amidohydrolase